MGLLLYVLTLLGEVPAMVFRYWLVSLFAPSWLALVVALLPQVWSLVTLVGLPGGHRLTAWELGARVPSQREQREIEQTFKHLSREGVRLPYKTFILDTPTVNAFVVGSTLYLNRQLVWTPYLMPVTAHELGHVNSLDGRLSLAIHRLMFPGAVWLIRQLLLGQVGLSNILSSFAIRGCFLAAWLLWLALLGLFLFNGGFGVWLLSLAWRNYWRGREYLADAFAAKLGQGNQLAEALEANYLLLDMATPWLVWTNRSHPYTEYRIDRLQRLAAGEQLDDALEPHERHELVAISTLSGGAVLIFFGMCAGIPLVLSGMVATAEQASGDIEGEVQQRFDSAQVAVERRAEEFIQRQAHTAREEMLRTITGQDPSVPSATGGALRAEAIPCNVEVRSRVDQMWLLKEPEDNAAEIYYLGQRARGTVVCEDVPGWAKVKIARDQSGWIRDTELVQSVEVEPS